MDLPRLSGAFRRESPRCHLTTRSCFTPPQSSVQFGFATFSFLRNARRSFFSILATVLSPLLHHIQVQPPRHSAIAATCLAYGSRPVVTCLAFAHAQRVRHHRAEMEVL